MYNKNSSIPEKFIQAVQIELENQLDGISEYNLIQNLKAQGYFDFLSTPALPHELFHAHFFLFHALYLLHDVFLNKKIHLLEINTLKIQLSPYHEGDNDLQKEDKLRAYYLDFNNLDKTSEDDVYDMLASFWNKVNHFNNREEALTELGLKDPIDDKRIKKEYRRLAMLHHPDRGGDTDKLQKINDALALLLG